MQGPVGDVGDESLGKSLVVAVGDGVSVGGGTFAVIFREDGYAEGGGLVGPFFGAGEEGGVCGGGLEGDGC